METALKPNRSLMRAAAALVLFAAATPAFAEGPFSPLQGSWNGGGTINMRDGSTERLRCRATYSVGGGGNSVSQNLNCASDSYNVVISSNATANGNSLSGSWSETTRGVSGQLSGTVNAGNINAQVNGGVFGAGIGIATRGSSQSVSIRVNGGDVQSVALSLNKR